MVLVEKLFFKQSKTKFRLTFFVTGLFLAFTHLSHPLSAQDFIAGSSIAKEEVLRKIPKEYIDKARRELVIAYQHTSHGTHVTRGVYGLQDYKAGDTLLFGVSETPAADSLEFRDYALEDYAPSGVEAIDLSVDEDAFIQTTRNYLDAPENATVNVVMWSWCNIDGHDAAGTYLPGMSLLISEYGPGGTKIGTDEGQREIPVNFIFMTGHANMDANVGEPTRPKEQADTINSYCNSIQQFCLDYYSIDTHDMNDNYWEDASDDGYSASYGGYFYHDWQDSHILGEDYFENRMSPGGVVVYGEHTTQHITANRKGYAMWWILARIAGWDGDTSYIPVTGIEFDIRGDSSEIRSGDTLRILATVMPDSATYQDLEWSIFPGSGTATLDSLGLFTAGKQGTVMVVATARDTSGYSDTLNLNILPPLVPVTSITLESAGGHSELESGARLQFFATVIPDSATNRDVKWNVLDESGTAVIDSSGLLTAGNPGTVTVIALASDSSGVSGSFQLNIIAPEILVTGITLSTVGDVTELSAGGTLQLLASVLPENASNKTLEWSVLSDTGKATINEDGLLSADMPGGIWVVAVARDGSGVTDSLELAITSNSVEVSSIKISSAGGIAELYEGEMLQLYVAVNPEEADNKSVHWHVTAAKNSNGQGSITSEGMFIALTEGEVDVVALAQDGSGIYDLFVITILGPSGLGDEASENLLIYPNPGRGLFYLDAGGQDFDLIQVVDAHGALVQELTPGAGQQLIELDLSTRRSGLYFVKARGDNKLIVRKVILNR